jgi:hypothetical protein
LLGDLIAVAAIIAAVTRVFFIRVALFFIVRGGLRRRGVFSSFIFFD